MWLIAAVEEGVLEPEARTNARLFAGGGLTGSRDTCGRVRWVGGVDGCPCG